MRAPRLSRSLRALLLGALSLSATVVALPSRAADAPSTPPSTPAAPSTPSTPPSTPAAPSTPAPPSTPAIVFHALPQGHLATVPDDGKRPATVPAGSRAPGVFVARPPQERGEHDGSVQVFVLGSPEAAADVRRGDFSGSRDPAVSGCITTENRQNAGGEPWFGSARSSSSVAWQPMSPDVTGPSRAMMAQMNPRVQAVHVEHLARAADGKTATLDWADAWVDPVTAAARGIDHGSLPLARVATGILGIEVFAARGAPDDKVVHFVMRSGDGGGDEMLRALAREIELMSPDGMGGESTDCGFMRVTLPAAAGQGEIASFRTEAVLPPLRPPPAEDGPNDEAAKFRARMLAARAARRRPLLVHVSASQTSVDPEPLASVSFGWAGPEDGR